jgi:hypothetical protein
MSYKRSLLLFNAMVLIAVLFVSGCKKDETTTTPTVDKTIPADVFPLTRGNQFVYTGWFTTQDTETPVAGSSSFYRTSWTIINVDTPLAKVYGPLYNASKSGGRTNAALILDSTLVNPSPAVYKLTPVAAYKDAATNDYFYLTNLGLFFRQSVVKDSASAAKVRGDSLRFIKLASPNAGLGAEFKCFEETFTSYANPQAATPITLTITGKWADKTEDVTVNGTTFTGTYPIVISRVAKAGTTVVSTGITARIWLAKGIGPVKMFLVGDAEVPGNYRELKSKNF